ncbi:MAG: hypothetical protein JO192_11710, partial [Candidatus Eremiobacteraeota bacterium]|nr:hypothetical protein [Candidatus Eremiobacteraeota bacterium]
CVALGIPLTGCSATSSAASSSDGTSQPSGASADPSDAIQRYVTGEDNDFADLQGDPMHSSSPGYAYFGSTQPIPGTANCVVYVFKQSGSHFAHCDLAATTLAAAKTTYQTWLSNVKDAEPYWHAIEVQPLPAGDVAATMYADNREEHGIYVSVSKVGTSSYRVSATFAKMAALKS